MTEYNDLKFSADIGADFKAFLGSGIGQYLVAKAENDEMKALRVLAEVDPSDSAEIFKLQVAARVPRQVVKWLNDVIKAGEDAKYLIKSIESDGDDY